MPAWWLLWWKSTFKERTAFALGKYWVFGISLAAGNVNHVIYDADFSHQISVLPSGSSDMSWREGSAVKRTCCSYWEDQGSVPSTYMDPHSICNLDPGTLRPWFDLCACACAHLHRDITSPSCKIKKSSHLVGNDWHPASKNTDCFGFTA